MGKPEKETRRDLPDIMEVDVSTEDAYAVIKLLSECASLKAQLDKKVDDEIYDKEFHLARRYEEVKEELAGLQTGNGLTGIRHNDLVFVCRLQKGRESLSKDLLIKALLSRGIHMHDITHAIKEATTQGEDYWVKELKVL